VTAISMPSIENAEMSPVACLSLPSLSMTMMCVLTSIFVFMHLGSFPI
jgi:hypothetical protein